MFRKNGLHNLDSVAIYSGEMITRGEPKGEREEHRHALHEDSIPKQTARISWQNKLPTQADRLLHKTTHPKNYQTADQPLVHLYHFVEYRRTKHIAE